MQEVAARARDEHGARVAQRRVLAAVARLGAVVEAQDLDATGHGEEREGSETRSA
jgi:hypothetical protein